ncbi:PREDICTED: uncharacterized protein LOC109193581 isoform X2 [Ipomoea nil]|uniref:uncharacterized protein LOC109193581 isoform X2 n=1 Tax=Ipomoea nil TaxID=35883 RepID=UPI000900A623|nr:PREDICTED: uncharacterized protein LOC109193581 isoform X2 [Ipomoea nil]
MHPFHGFFYNTTIRPSHPSLSLSLSLYAYEHYSSFYISNGFFLILTGVSSLGVWSGLKKMQCTSYTLGCYYLRDLNVGLGGCSWSTANSDIVWNGGHRVNVLLPPPTMDHDLCPQKEICRQMMLKHESTFKYQVYELHRLYRRQKELMEETRNRELLAHSLKLPLVSEAMSEISMETHLPSRNVSGIRPSFPSPQMFQEPSRFVAGNNEELATHKRAIQDDFEGCQHSSSQRKKSRKRMLDLELPGDLYIDSEEENEVQVPKTPITNLWPVNESKLASFYPEGSSMSDSSCRKTNLLFDLNEPAQPDESEFPSSSSLLESDSSQHDIANQNQDLSEKEKSNADCSLPNKETLLDITVGEGHYDACKISPLLEKDKENGLLPCNTEAGGNRSDLNQFAEESCCLTPSNECKRRRTLDSKISEKNCGEASIDVPSFVSSLGKSINDSEEFPILVQALPCINDTSLNKCHKSSISKPRLSRRKFNLNKIKPAGSRSTRDADSVNTSGPNDKVTDSSGKYEAADSNLDLIPTEQQKYDTERDLKAPISPENRECSPPRADSQETRLEDEEVSDRLAADTLVLILSSGVHKYSKTGIEQPEVSIGCLDWFAGIASTLVNDQNDLLRSGVHDCIEARKKNVANSKAKHCARKVKVENVKETVDASLPCRLKKTKSEPETKDRACSGRRKARSGHAKGMRSSKALKTSACSHFKQQNDGKKLSSAERRLEVWGSKKKRMARRATSTPLFSVQVFGISS